MPEHDDSPLRRPADESIGETREYSLIDLLALSRCKRCGRLHRGECDSAERPIHEAETDARDGA